MYSRRSQGQSWYRPFRYGMLYMPQLSGAARTHEMTVRYKHVVSDGREQPEISRHSVRMCLQTKRLLYCEPVWSGSCSEGPVLTRGGGVLEITSLMEQALYPAV